LYGGDVSKAGWLLGINGTVWAVTALIAVAPLNWISRRFGKRNALLLAILLMCAAQLSKIVCYRPGTLFHTDLPAWLGLEAYWGGTVEAPFLVLIPTVLLSAGMLMFFTLGSSMVGDVCDEDELQTGTRTEGTYFAVFWWFIKMGTAVASIVAGTLLVYTAFDQEQNATVEKLRGNIAVMKEETAKWEEEDVDTSSRLSKLNEQLDAFDGQLKALHEHLIERAKESSEPEHYDSLVERTAMLRSQADELRKNGDRMVASPAELSVKTDAILAQTAFLQQQTPSTLFRLRAVEIGLPLALSVVSIVLALNYPLTEQRSYEIKDALKARRQERVDSGSPDLP
jgi:GPH family glycoside/pentoside/hexuronide:cation symporter